MGSPSASVVPSNVSPEETGAIIENPSRSNDVLNLLSRIINIKCFYTTRYGKVRAFRLTGVIHQLDFAPQFTLLDPTHIGGFIFMPMQLRGSRGGTLVEVLLRCLYNRDNAAISTGVVLSGRTVKITRL